MPSAKITSKMASKCRDYLISELCLMNGLRSSNVIELRLVDVDNVMTNSSYPGQKIIENLKYKTSSIYGENFIAIPAPLFEHLELYIKYCRPVILAGKHQRDCL